MEYITYLIDFIIHIDVHLSQIIAAFGLWTYFILFIIVFCETGFVITPFLPGDSLLFAAGTFAALGLLNPLALFVVLSIAGVLGDTLNYWTGNYIGPKAFRYRGHKLFRREYLDKTEKFYEKHGGKTIIIARFMPIIRTFAPFVAGIGAMNYRKFLVYNVTGGVLWVGSFVFLGYFFGNIPVVKKNFTVVIFAIIIISVMPGVIEFVRHHLKKKP